LKRSCVPIGKARRETKPPGDWGENNYHTKRWDWGKRPSKAGKKTAAGACDKTIVIPRRTQTWLGDFSILREDKKNMQSGLEGEGPDLTVVA